MVQSNKLIQFQQLKHFFCKDYVDDSESISLNQVHGKDIFVATKNSCGTINNYDGMVTKSNSLLTIRTADCLPILFFDSKNRIVGVVHAGWKGLSLGIVKEAITTLHNLGSKSSNIFVAIGPHIRDCCYNVSQERIEVFQQIVDPSITMTRVDKNGTFLNLLRITNYLLISEGIASEHIDSLPFCTFCNSRFSSFRRDGPSCRRMISGIQLRTS